MHGISGKLKTLLLAVVVVAALYYAFVLFTGDTAPESTSVVATELDLRRQAVEQDVIAELERLQRIELDDQFFASPVFRALQDFAKPLPNVEVGRPNPFAPVGESFDSAASSEEPAAAGESGA